MKKSIVFFTGFMGSGKSTIGPIIANTLGWEFYDLDKVIENKTGLKVKEIFEKYGEEYFRNLEYDNLIEAAEGDKKIVSLGGGTITSAANLKLIKETGILIYLKITPQDAFKRLKFKRDRPVLLSGLSEDFKDEELMKNIEMVFEKRKPLYEQADFIFDTGSVRIGKTVDQLIKRIQKELNKNV